MLRLRGKDSDLKQTPDIKPQIFSLQNDPLDYNSFFSACILTYTPIIINALAPNMVETQNFASLQQNESKQKFGPQSKNLASVVRGFKIGVTKYANNHEISFAWQPRFHDHIIRNVHEMNHIADYINNNVIR